MPQPSSENQVMKFLSLGPVLRLSLVFEVALAPIFLNGTFRWYWWCLSVSLASP